MSAGDFCRHHSSDHFGLTNSVSFMWLHARLNCVAESMLQFGKLVRTVVKSQLGSPYIIVWRALSIARDRSLISQTSPMAITPEVGCSPLQVSRQGADY